MLYHTVVIRNAYMYVKDYHTAEDISQEAFARLGENLDRVAPEKVRTWLLRVSGRLAMDHLRKGGKCEVTLGLEEFSEELVSNDYSDLSEMMVRKEDIEYRTNALMKLKEERPQWYDVLLMSYLEEMDLRSIGKELGIKPSLVGKWRERARDLLWDWYTEDSEE